MNTGLRGHALVIGINAYNGGIKPLQSAVRDATAIAGILRDKHDYSVTCLCDDEAVRGAIEKQLTESIPSNLDTDCAFLLYFAGHGVAVGDGTQGAQGYLLPQDAVQSDEDTWLSMTTLRSALEVLPCRHVLIVLDCCFAGSFRWASTRDATVVFRPLYDSQFERYLKGDAWQALTSASHDERAADLSPGRHNNRDADTLDEHSPFAAALIRGLSGAADSSRAGFDTDGVITATELYQYVFEELMAPDAGFDQTPGIWPLRPDNKGEFVFLNPESEINTRSDPPLDDANNPWLGLKTYTEESKGLFFGRQRVVKDLLDKLLKVDGISLLAVVGASGTGKSSVVKAGLLPLLIDPPDELKDRIGDWTIVQSPRLADDPGQQLDQALEELEAAPAGHRTLLLIDQFEELYTQCPDEALRAKFLRRLKARLRTDGGLMVVVTLRSDFEPRPSSDPALQDIWPKARYVVPAFSTDELRDVIEGPANAKALYFEPEEVVGKLLDEVTAMPGGLPLLSFALSEMYRCAQLRRRKTGSADRALMQDDYDETGGVVGAVQKRATLLYDTAEDDSSRETIRRVFLRLINKEGTRVTRRRVRRQELEFGDDEEQQRVAGALDRYVSGRLLVADDEFVEPAHDTLVLAWEKLQDWLAQSDSLKLIRSAWHDASEWHTHETDKTASGYLWDSDPRLPLLVESFPELNRLEQAFVTASVKRQKGRKRLVRSITVSLLVVFAAITAWALNSRDQALEQEKLALTQAGHASWQRAVSARDYEHDDVRAAHLFATAAQAFADGGQAQLATNSISGIEQGTRDVVATFPNNDAVMDAMFTDDKTGVISWAEDGTARRWDIGLQVPPKTFQHNVGARPSGALFHQDGSVALSWNYDDGIVQMWEVARAEPLRTFQNRARKGSGFGTGGAVFNVDASQVLSWTDVGEGEISLWDIKQCDSNQCEPVNTFEHSLVSGAAFGDEWMLSWSNFDGTVRLWRGTEGDRGTDPDFEFETKDVLGAHFLADESKLLSWGDWVVQLRDIDAMSTAEFDHKRVHGAYFYGNGARVLSWGGDGTIQLTQGNIEPLIFDDAGDAPVNGAVLDDDESRMLSWNYDGTVRLWDVRTGQLLKNYRHAPGSIAVGASFGSDGTHVLSWGTDGTVRVWDARDQQPLKTFKHQEGVGNARFNHDESKILSWAHDGSVRLWDVETAQQPEREFTHLIEGRAPHAMEADDESGEVIFEVVITADDESEGAYDESERVQIRDALFTDDESGAVSWDSNGRVHLWDFDDTEGPERTFEHGTGGEIEGMLFSSDRSRVVSWGDYNPARQSDIDRPELARVFIQGEVGGVWINDDESKVLSWDGGALQLWDRTIDEATEYSADGYVWGASFISERSELLSWHSDQKIRLWNIDQQRPRSTFGIGVEEALVSNSGSHVLSWGSDDTIQLWDIAPEVEPRRSFKHEDIRGTAFNHDESRMLSWGHGEVLLWDLEQDAYLRRFKHERVVGASLNRCESKLLTWGDDATIRLWEMPKFNDASTDCPGETFRSSHEIDIITLKLEVRTAATINELGEYRLLEFDEWQEKRKQLLQLIQTEHLVGDTE